MSWFKNIIAKLAGWFTSPKAKALANMIAQIANEAFPVVQEIAVLVPNKTVQEIIAAYAKYGVPLVQTELSDPTLAGNALLNLASAVVRKNFPTATATTINTAVQLAVSALAVHTPPAAPTPVK